MEEAYEEALQRLGGLAEARPRQVLEELAPEFPQLTSKVRQTDMGLGGRLAVPGACVEC